MMTNNDRAMALISLYFISGERPFRCQICSKAFADKSNLRAHVQTHSNNKPFTCGRCGKTFALKSYLYKHEEAACLSKGENKNEEISDGVDHLVPG